MSPLADLLVPTSNLAVPLFAYIGPGLGGGVIAVILGFIASIFLAIFALFWYPIKRLLGIKTKPKPKKQTHAEPSVPKEGASSGAAPESVEGETRESAGSDRASEP